MATTFFTNNLGIANGSAGVILCCAILFGAIGAFLYAWMGSQIGYGRALAVSYFQWIITLLLTYSLLHGPKDVGWMFLIVPILGLCFGGSLTLARSVYASMIEPGTEAEMFGMFNFCQCSLGWAAILLFTFVNEATNCLRTGFLSQIVFLLPALILQLSIEFEWKMPKQQPAVALDSVAESR
ncbi:hypothetical protein BVRB_031040 [Beta vulgaris subsp. vulgaris]|uniref:Major facilitator superfamily (MFS) profile domain-containing protein n=1 Tax=Beta vulgaris subsp. vulgaris TaxID=3555 RepID=A0A0J8AXK5_BETVV|nr:hypothetical protein BVRB_031040 [Beta vulgaris subsp. vulgaris]